MLVLAHRGYHHAPFPENTLAAFEAAVALGVDGIETDVRLDRDGLPILIHDRVLPNGKAVASLSRVGIEAILGHPVPTLDEALACAPRLLWNVEIKTAAALEPAVALMNGRPGTQFLLTSFRHDVVARAATLLDADCGLLLASRPLDLGALLEGCRDSARLRTLVWDYEILDEALLDLAYHAGWRNLVYGVASPEEHEHCRKLPLHGVITDHPSLLLAGR